MTAGKSVPSWVRARLSPADVQKIEDAVTVVENNSQGEIVPMVVERSVQREPIQVGLTLFLLFSVIFLVVDQYITFPEMLHDEMFELIEFAIAAALGFSLARLDSIQRIFVSQDELVSRVYEKAELEFYRARIDRTQKHVGILLFLSLAEKRAVVLADKGIAEKLQPDDWLSVVRLMTKAASEDQLGTGLCDAIRECGKVLQQHFPSTEKKGNEISNKLIFRD